MIYNYFTHQYPVSKTLRFELKPINETTNHLVKILEQDECRSENYKKVKKLIDEYHKQFIERILGKMELSIDLLKKYAVLYHKRRNNSEVKSFRSIQKDLRENVVKTFIEDETYKILFKQELIEKELPAFLKKEEDRKLVEEFKGFTTYFQGFNENRANMYSQEEKHTAIAYRLINENLPKFLDNMVAFEKIMECKDLKEQVQSIYQNFSEELEKLSVKDIETLFKLESFNKTLTQKQIGVYNAIIGGRTLNEEKIQGINEYVNLYNQKNKGSKIPKLKALFKQILSDQDSLSFTLESYQKDNELLADIRSFYESLSENVLGEGKLKMLLESLGEYDLEGIFICNDTQLTDISQRIFGNWNAIETMVMEQMKAQNPLKKKEDNERYYQRIKKLYTSRESFSIQELNFCIKAGIDTERQKRIEDYFRSLDAVDTGDTQRENIFARIENAYTELKPLLSIPYPEENNLVNDKKSVAKIKKFLDALKDLQRFIKPLLGKGDEADKDTRFSGDFYPLWVELDKVTPLYNKVRNYLTRKPYSQEKFKLNFENSTLMAGWDQNREKANTTVILMKDGLYYLGIMNKRYNKIFDASEISDDGLCYQKMIYKLLPGANKMLPKVFFSKSRIEEFKPSKEIIDIKEKGSYKGKNFDINDCHALIDFYKQSIERHPDWKEFGFKFSDTKTYENIDQFFEEVEQQAYKISFQNVSVDYIDRLVKEGKLYLFQIYNKDFSPYSKGTPNMHTLYWKMLFDEKNLKDVVYKLSGDAEVFYRKKSIKYERPTHPAKVTIKNKNNLNKKKESVFEYDLVKDKRYTVDKFMFHVPIVMNFKSKNKEDFNLLARQYLKSASDLHVIGIDRGERHLLYLVVIDAKGNIVEQFSLNSIANEINGDTCKTDYHGLLDIREQERQEARKSWDTIEKIKNLKEGYLSQVVHRIANMMVKYNAIVVLEDLNMGFMRGRQKVEKQVYQKFEKMLIDKLNYLVDKKKAPQETGGLLNAYQLTSKFESFQKLGKQSGFLFYVPAWNTSKIDPVTGFVNLFDTRYKNIEESRLFFSKFDSIRYNVEEDRFEFKFDYVNFTDKATGTQTKWTLCANNQTRIRTKRNPDKNNQWDSVEVKPVEEFKKLFQKYGIDIHGNLKESISVQTQAEFFQRLLDSFTLILQLRNSVTGTDTDYLLSPVCDKDGRFFDSRECDKSLPENADANGAYNIARKGLMLLKQLKDPSQNLQKPNYDLSNKAWLQFAQNVK